MRLHLTGGRHQPRGVTLVFEVAQHLGLMGSQRGVVGDHFRADQGPKKLKGTYNEEALATQFVVCEAVFRM